MSKYFWFFSILLGLSSCRALPYLYVPDNLNMPLPGNKHEIKTTIYANGNSGYGLQASYAVDSHIVVYADGNKINQSNKLVYKIGYQTRNLKSEYNYLIVDAGGGYYTHIGKYFRFDATAGLGYGSANATTNNLLIDYNFFSRQRAPDTLENLNITAHYFRINAQIDFALHTKPFELALGVRFSELLPSGNYCATYSDTSNIIRRQKLMPLNQGALLIEPGLMMTAGIKNVKIETQFGLSYQLNGLKVDKYYGDLYFPYFISMGLTFNLFNRN
jgi:hypothetical protein